MFTVSSPSSSSQPLNQLLGWIREHKWHLTALATTGVAVWTVCALILWRRAQNVARLEVQAQATKKARKGINLADVDAKRSVKDDK